MAVGKRIYLKRHMPDKEVMMQFKNIPASNTCDVMGRNAAMNPRIRLVSQPKAVSYTHLPSVHHSNC